MKMGKFTGNVLLPLWNGGEIAVWKFWKIQDFKSNTERSKRDAASELQRTAARHEGFQISSHAQIPSVRCE